MSYVPSNVMIQFIPPDSEFELTKKSKSFTNEHQKNIELNKELEEAVKEAETDAKTVMAIDQTLSLQLSLNSSGDYALSKKGQTLEDIHQQNVQEQKDLMHEIEQLKKESIMKEAQEAAKDKEFMFKLNRIEKEHEHQKRKQEKIMKETDKEIGSALQSEKTFSQQFSLNSSGDYIISKKIKALDELHQISKEEQQKIIDEIDEMQKLSLIEEAIETAEDEASIQELDKIKEEHERSKREQKKLMIEAETLEKIYKEYQDIEEKIVKTEREIYHEHQKDLKSRVA